MQIQILEKNLIAKKKSKKNRGPRRSTSVITIDQFRKTDIFDKNKHVSKY